MSIFDTFKYPVNVVIDDVRHGNYVRRYDKAKAIYDLQCDIPEYKLKKIKSTIKPPSFDCIVRDENGKDNLHLIQIERNRFIPVVLPKLDGSNPDHIDLKAKTEEDVVVNTWRFVVMEKKKLKYTISKFFEKYGAMISLAIVAMVIIFSLIFTQQYLQKIIVTQTDKTVTALDNVAKRLEGTTDIVRSNSPSSPTPQESPP
jgi:hypothetical protein